jgi:hypothetical protein
LSMSIRLITSLLTLALLLQLGLGCLQLTVRSQKRRVYLWCRSGGGYVATHLVDVKDNQTQCESMTTQVYIDIYEASQMNYCSRKNLPNQSSHFYNKT